MANKNNSMSYSDWDIVEKSWGNNDQNVLEMLKDEARRLDKGELERRFRNLARMTSTGELQVSNLSMIDTFMDDSRKNAVVSTDKPCFEFSAFTQKAFEHSTTKQFIKDVEVVFSEKLREIPENGNFPASVNITEDVKKAVKQKKFKEPEFSNAFDYIFGLTFAVHNVRDYIVTASNISRNGESYQATLQVTLIDDFGLDSDDVVEYGTMWKVFERFRPNTVIPASVVGGFAVFAVATPLALSTKEWRDGKKGTLAKIAGWGFVVLSAASVLAFSVGMAYKPVLQPRCEEVAAGFRAWFILQHFYGYRPFSTKMERKSFEIGGKIL